MAEKKARKKKAAKKPVAEESVRLESIEPVSSPRKRTQSVKPGPRVLQSSHLSILGCWTSNRLAEVLCSSLPDTVLELDFIAALENERKRTQSQKVDPEAVFHSLSKGNKK
jgi:hypothetical protein